MGWGGRAGGGVLQGQNVTFRIHMWNQWNGRPICRGMGAGSTPSPCLLGYSSNKSMEWFYYCIDWRNCAASTKRGTKHRTSHFFVSLGNVILPTGANCSFSQSRQTSLGFQRFIDECNTLGHCQFWIDYGG